MIGDMMLYAANRATQGAVENVARKASWGGFAVFLLLVGTIFSIFVAYWWLESRSSAIAAGSIIAAACFVVGIVCLSMPGILDRLEARAKKPADPIIDTVNAVKVEVTEAVDYFGPIRVVASAFMLGLGIARSVKR
jgi:ABC-type transport system involved in multi-copper enzyme maturation permease subunit